MYIHINVLIINEIKGCSFFFFLILCDEKSDLARIGQISYLFTLLILLIYLRAKSMH